MVLAQIRRARLALWLRSIISMLLHRRALPEARRYVENAIHFLSQPDVSTDFVRVHQTTAIRNARLTMRVSCSLITRWSKLNGKYRRSADARLLHSSC